MKKNFYLLFSMTVMLFSTQISIAQNTAGPVTVTSINGDSTVIAGNTLPTLYLGDTVHVTGTYGNPGSAKWVRISLDIYKSDWSGTEYSYAEFVADDTTGTFDGNIDYKFVIPDTMAAITAQYVGGFPIIQVRVEYDPAEDTFWNTFVDIQEEAASIGMPVLEGLSIYPNPVRNGFVMIETPDSKLKNVKLFEVTGKLIFEKEIRGNQKLDVSTLNKGLYILRVEEDGYASSQKLVIN